jgi:glucose/mannose-6-phosphate isomerase
LVYGLLLGMLTHLNIPFSLHNEVATTLEALLRQQTSLKANVPLARNPAKRIAGQFLERWVSLFAAEHLTPIARRWKTQINELAKALAFLEIIPEADYNALMGFSNPAEEISHGMIFFLQSALYHPRNQLRMEMTRKALMLEGINSDFYTPPADTLLAQQCCALHFGDYLAYYLAMLYEIDPTPVDLLESLKMDLAT